MGVQLSTPSSLGRENVQILCTEPDRLKNIWERGRVLGYFTSLFPLPRTMVMIVYGVRVTTGQMMRKARLDVLKAVKKKVGSANVRSEF